MTFYRALRPLLFRLPPERAHAATLHALRLAAPLLPTPPPDDHALAVAWGKLNFSNPFGLAAGFDKNGTAITGCAKLGFGFVEIGTLTPRPQSGNPPPRLFRLTHEGALINRLGFNNRGMDAAASALQRQAGHIVGVNIGANRDSTDKIADYEAAAQKLGGLADYLTVNVSSPNTPGLRDLQGGAQLAEIVARVRKAAPDTLVAVKIAPDLSPQEAADIAAVALAENFDALIISNTTTARAGVESHRHAHETGGLSGRPLRDAATALLADMHRATGGKIFLIGVGGITTAQDAYDKIRAGASLVQLYTGLVYEGAGLVRRLKSGLVELLRRDGIRLSEAVGCDTD